jgi:hypothetical protein
MQLRIADFELWIKEIWKSAIRNPQYYYTPFDPSVKDGCEKASLWPGNA